MRSPTDQPLDAGLLRVARLGSAAGLILCLLGWGVLGTLSIVDEGEMNHSTPRVTMTGLAVLSLGLTFVYLACRVMRELRKNRALLEAVLQAAHDADPAHGDDGSGLDPESLALARQLSARLHSVS